MIRYAIHHYPRKRLHPLEFFFIALLIIILSFLPTLSARSLLFLI